jgi:GTP-binding protein
MMMSNATTTAQAMLRNIAIIAHVDHGKTTLVDSLFKQSGLFRDNEVLSERMMDSNDLEKERGITILAKNTAIPYKDYRINILDTPGHADFSGEVERVLTLVDAAVLIVDAVEGPMPQTRFVLRKALEHKLHLILVVNKVDRPAAEPARVIDETLELLLELGADESQLDLPIVYASGLAGQSTLCLKEGLGDMKALFETIIEHVPAPTGDADAPLQLQVATLDYNDYVGRILIGRIHRGTIKLGQTVSLCRVDGTIANNLRINKLFGFEGLKRTDIDMASVGDIVAVAGIEHASIGDTLCDPATPEALPDISIEQPTLQMTFSVNNSPLAGREGKFVTSRQLRERLYKEIRTNISLQVEDTDSTDSFFVCGRGELHLSILIETMRREGFEFQVSKPQVLTKTNEQGQKEEPFETLEIDVPESSGGACIEKLSQRKGELQSMEQENGRSLLSFAIPARGLLGFRSEFIRLTRGEGMMNSSFLEYRPWAGEIGGYRNGALLAHEAGEITTYALKNMEDRGRFFVEPKVQVYRGMIVGEHCRQGDLALNVCKEKKLTNMRSAGQDVLDGLQPPVELTLEFALDFLNQDELMEVTPKNIRLRKADLTQKW